MSMISALNGGRSVDPSLLLQADGAEPSGAASVSASQPVKVEALLTLPEPYVAPGADTLFELVTLMTRVSQSDRKDARQTEHLEEMARRQSENAKIQEMHDQASAIRNAGWASGLGAIASGIGQVGAGTSAELKCKLDWNDAWKAIDKSGEGAGKVVSSYFERQQKLDQANAEADGANAERAGRGAQEAAEDAQAALDLLKKIESFYEQMLQAQNGALNAAANLRV